MNVPQDRRIPVDKWQLQAAIADESALITGGPASGKSQALAARAVPLLHKGEGRRPIAFFTVRDESVFHLREILEQYPMIGPRVDDVFVGTVDQWSNAVLRSGGREALNLRPDYSIWNEKQALDIMQVVLLGDLGEKPERAEIRRALRWYWQNQRRWPGDPAVDAPKRNWLAWAQLYASEKVRLNAVDCWDLPVMALRALDRDPLLQTLWGPDGFRHILVDQAEELTPAQVAFIQRLASRSGSLSVAADPNQAISPDADDKVLGYLRLAWPGLQDYPLRGCHRTTRRLARMAAAFRQALDMPSFSDDGEESGGPEGAAPELVMVEGVLEDMYCHALEEMQLLHAEGVRWEDIAVLDKRGLAIGTMRAGLLHRDIPHRVLVGPAPDNPTDGRSIIALVTLAVNPFDVAALRVAGAPGYPNKDRILADRTADLIMTEARHRKTDLITAARMLSNSGNILEEDRRSITCIAGCSAGLQRYLAGELPTLADLLEWVQEMVARAKPRGLEEPGDPETADLMALCRSMPPQANETRQAHLLRFLDLWSLALHPARPYQGRDGVTFSSIHHAKGARWDVVIVLDVSDQTIPGKTGPYSSRLAEEGRLFHVAITRARKRLYLCCLTDTGRSDRSTPSQFLDPIRGHLEERRVGPRRLDPFGEDLFGHLRPK